MESEAKVKLCIFCGIEVKPVITTPHALYGVPADEPGALRTFWDGGYYCPKCLAGNCWVMANEKGELIPDEDELANLKHWFSRAMGKQKPPSPVLAQLLKLNTQ